MTQNVTHLAKIKHYDRSPISRF